MHDQRPDPHQHRPQQRISHQPQGADGLVDEGFGNVQPFRQGLPQAHPHTQHQGDEVHQQSLPQGHGYIWGRDGKHLGGVVKHGGGDQGEQAGNNQHHHGDNPKVGDADSILDRAPHPMGHQGHDNGGEQQRHDAKVVPLDDDGGGVEGEPALSNHRG